jgi:hypothetical protein
MVYFWKHCLLDYDSWRSFSSIFISTISASHETTYVLYSIPNLYYFHQNFSQFKIFRFFRENFAKLKIFHCVEYFLIFIIVGHGEKLRGNGLTYLEYVPPIMQALDLLGKGLPNGFLAGIFMCLFECWRYFIHRIGVGVPLEKWILKRKGLDPEDQVYSKKILEEFYNHFF